VAERLAPGMLVEEYPGRETLLDAFPTGATAFIGPAPRGPIDTAVIVTSPDDYGQVFSVAGCADPMGQSIQDFFAAGGSRAVVVRVANGARPCTLSLPGHEGPLVLEALSPGRREYLRASVDYDQIDPSDEVTFNLVVQRLREPGTERVVDQEIYRRLSLRPSSERFVTDVLMASQLVRVRGALPPLRPGASVSTSPGYPVTWVNSADDGAEGRVLTDYDVIGSYGHGTGLFALDGAGPIDFLCLPPAVEGRRAGPTLLLAALRYCRRQRALLLLEPPAELTEAEQALAWLRNLNIAGENAVAVFPRLAAAGRNASRTALGAVAGVLARAPADAEPSLERHFRPAREVPPEMRRRLLAEGLNVLTLGRGGQTVLAGDHTLASPQCTVPAWRSLRARRLALAIERTLLQGTRWVVFEPPGPERADRLRGQLSAWLESMRFAGRLAGGMAEAWFVDVSEVPAARHAGMVEFTVGFAPLRASDFIIYRVSQGLHDARLVPISAERWAITRPARAFPGIAPVQVPGGEREAG
jgi:uncharacterized protein